MMARARLHTTQAAAFFLYDPIYSLYVSDPREVGELILFAITGLIGAKCTAELTRSPEKEVTSGHKSTT